MPWLRMVPLSNKVLPKQGKKLVTLPHNAMAQDDTSLTRCSPKRGKELATLAHNAMAQDDTSLTRCSSKRGKELATLARNAMAQFCKVFKLEIYPFWECCSTLSLIHLGLIMCHLSTAHHTNSRRWYCEFNAAPT